MKGFVHLAVLATVFLFASLQAGDARAASSCPAGQYLSSTNVCKPCEAGKHCPAGTKQASLVACKVGFYCPAAAAPVACPAGTKSTAVGASAASTCSACTAGTYSSAPGSSACAACYDTVSGQGLGTWSGPAATKCTPINCGATPGYVGNGPACSCAPYYKGTKVTFGGGKPQGCTAMSCTQSAAAAGSVVGNPGACTCAPGYSGKPVTDANQVIGGCTQAACSVSFANMKANSACKSFGSGTTCTPECAAGFTISSTAALSCSGGVVSGTVPSCTAAPATVYCPMNRSTEGCPDGKTCRLDPSIQCNGQMCQCRTNSCAAGFQCPANSSYSNPCVNVGTCQ